MRVYLLTADDGNRHFYSEAPESPESPHQPSRTGLRGWVERKVRTLQTAWNHADHGLAGRIHRAWDWLVRRTPPDEPMLVQLRTATTVEIHHPTSLTEEEVQVLWVEYLASRKRRHLPRFGINALIAPLTVVLAPLPGPNLVGYWFTYRAVRHLAALLGLRRARSDRVATSFHPNDALDWPIDHEAGPLSRLTRHKLSRARIIDFLRRSRSGARPRPRTETFSLAANHAPDYKV